MGVFPHAVIGKSISFFREKLFPEEAAADGILKALCLSAS
jgi:hypothetical protein